MGLDMYLNKKVFIGADYKHRNVKGKIEITEGKDNTPIKINFNRVFCIEESIGCWRKANQIHEWFIQNVQDGNDDCESYPVSYEQLKLLLDECRAVIENKDKASEKLPTRGGFLFGSTEYDEYYFEDIEKTIKIIEELFAEDIAYYEEKPYLKNEVYYSSSW